MSSTICSIISSRPESCPRKYLPILMLLQQPKQFSFIFFWPCNLPHITVGLAPRSFSSWIKFWGYEVSVCVVCAHSGQWFPNTGQRGRTSSFFFLSKDLEKQMSGLFLSDTSLSVWPHKLQDTAQYNKSSTENYMVHWLQTWSDRHVFWEKVEKRF